MHHLSHRRQLCKTMCRLRKVVVWSMIRFTSLYMTPFMTWNLECAKPAGLKMTSSYLDNRFGVVWTQELPYDLHQVRRGIYHKHEWIQHCWLPHLCRQQLQGHEKHCCGAIAGMTTLESTSSSHGCSLVLLSGKFKKSLGCMRLKAAIVWQSGESRSCSLVHLMSLITTC